jgi:uncharacterized protein
MSAAEFEIPISELDAGGKDYAFPLRTAWMRAVFEDTDVATTTKDGALALRVSKSGRDIVVHGTLEADLEAPCARCLQPAHIRVAQDVAALFSPRSELRAPKDKEYEFSAGEADVLPYDGETLVLDDLVRDELVLEIPMIPLCSEDCVGIQPAPVSEESAAAAAVDPRLAPLLKFKASREPKE